MAAMPYFLCCCQPGPVLSRKFLLPTNVPNSSRFKRVFPSIGLSIWSCYFLGNQFTPSVVPQSAVPEQRPHRSLNAKRERQFVTAVRELIRCPDAEKAPGLL